ncbi:MAG: OmpH family outer membrane protein [Bacteroidaceae bacterium]|nr:OmpH family outer membrane protein [Bacteroidaceae bacterium]MBQ3540077.1 OmpH family outer membrane protein [Bacteroidaceae bacterium]MBQ6693821.1 OmpH family outer membrane protein [Bacteroidaceae bacterium]MBR7166124.1 OmpH family outer membrane protein [Bacteroidaceae bacterium]
MKKILLTTFLMCIAAVGVQAQKYALIDMEYILKNIPAYERANEQLNQQSKRWQGEIDILTEEAQTLYKKYQSESMFLSDEQRTQREEEILNAEKKASELKRLYFGPDGELYKKRESLMAPIQDEIYNAVKDICDTKGYSMVIDRASAASIIYASPKIDISNDVLTKLGYSN